MIIGHGLTRIKNYSFVLFIFILVIFAGQALAYDVYKKSSLALSVLLFGGHHITGVDGAFVPPNIAALRSTPRKALDNVFDKPSNISDVSNSLLVRAPEPFALAPQFNPSKGELALMGSAFLGGVALATAGIVGQSPQYLSASAPLLASPVRSMASYASVSPYIGKGGLRRNLLYVFGGNLIGVAPVIGFIGNSKIALLKTSIASAAIFLLDRLFIVGNNPFSVARALTDADWSEKSFSRAVRAALPIILYTAGVFGFATANELIIGSIKGNVNLHSSAVIAGFTSVYPLAFIPVILASISQQNGAQSTLFRSRFIAASVATAAAISLGIRK